MILLASWGLLALGKSSLPALIAGIVVLDLGVQGADPSLTPRHFSGTVVEMVQEARG